MKIGLVAPFEGRYRYVGYDVIYAVRLALRQANAAGGVGGYAVELVAYDDGADPAMAVDQARKLAVDPEVVAVIGHFREDTTAVAWTTYAAAGIPLLAPASLDPAACGEQAACQLFRLSPPASAVADALLLRLAQPGDRRAALLTAGGSLGQALELQAQQHGGLLGPVVSPRDADWRGTITRSGVDAVLCDADPVVAGEVVHALRRAGWEGEFLGGPDLAAADFVAVAGQAARGAVFVTPWPRSRDLPAPGAGFAAPADFANAADFAAPADFANAADFAAAYRAVSNGVPPGPLAAPAYEATWVLVEALRRDIAARGRPTRAGIAKALPATGRQGVLGRITFDDGRTWAAAPLYTYRIDVQGQPQRVP